MDQKQIAIESARKYFRKSKSRIIEIIAILFAILSAWEILVNLAGSPSIWAALIFLISYTVYIQRVVEQRAMIEGYEWGLEDGITGNYLKNQE